MAGGTRNGNRTAPLTGIKTTTYGLVADGKDFPTCSVAKIVKDGKDTGCPKGALVATGSITATDRTGETDPSTSAPEQLERARTLPRRLEDADAGKIVFFFVEKGSSHQCAGAFQTGGASRPFRNVRDVQARTSF